MFSGYLLVPDLSYFEDKEILSSTLHVALGSYSVDMEILNKNVTKEQRVIACFKGTLYGTFLWWVFQACTVIGYV